MIQEVNVWHESKYWGRAIFALVSLLVFSMPATAWYDATWSFRQEINITGNYTPLYNFNATFNLTSGNVEGDCSDVIVVDSTDTKQVAHQTLYNGTNTCTVLWVTNESKAFLYYKNPAHADNQTRIRYLFENFDGKSELDTSALNNDTGSSASYVQIANNEAFFNISASGGSWAHVHNASNLSNDNIVVETKGVLLTGIAQFTSMAVFFNTTSDSCVAGWRIQGDNQLFAYTRSATDGFSSSVMAGNKGDWYVFRINFSSANSMVEYWLSGDNGSTFNLTTRTRLSCMTATLNNIDFGSSDITGGVNHLRANPAATGTGKLDSIQAWRNDVAYNRTTASLTSMGEQSLTSNVSFVSPMEADEFFVSNNFNITFRVSSPTNSTFTVQAFINNVLNYTNASYSNNTIITFQTTLGTARPYKLTVVGIDAGGSSNSSINFTISAFRKETLVQNASVFETTDQDFQEKTRVNFDLISNITGNLNYNNSLVGNQTLWERNSTHIQLTRRHFIPLMQVNNTNNSWFFANNVSFTNGTIVRNNSETNNQSVFFAVFPENISWNDFQYLEFDNAFNKLVVNDYANKATVTANFTVWYNTTTTTSNLVSTFVTGYSNKTFNQTISVELAFNLNETRNLTAYAIVSYNGSSRVMNFTNVTTLVFQQAITNCSVGTVSVTPALTFFMLDEENDDAINNASLQTSTNIIRNGRLIRNFAFSLNLSNTNNQSLCLYPLFTSIQHTTQVQYSKPSYAIRTYYVAGNLTNNTQNVNLYLLLSSQASQVIFKVLNEEKQPVSNVTLKIQRFFVGSNSYKTIAILSTDFEGKSVTNLKVADIYYKYLVEQNFSVLKETEPSQIVCTTSFCPPYVVIIDIAERLASFYFRTLGNIASACFFNETTSILRCTATDLTGTVKRFNFIVDKKQALTFETICDDSQVSSAVTFTCDLGNTTNGLYRYALTAVSNPTIYLEGGFLDFGQAIADWGTTGLFVLMLLIMGTGLARVTSAEQMIVAQIATLVLAYMIGLVHLSNVGNLIALIVVGAIVVWKLHEG